jgi:hypothetical protein
VRAVLYEDRASDVVAVKILVASIRRHAPTVEIDLTLPPATAADAAWLVAQGNVTLRTDATGLGAKYDVKPAVLARALREGADEAVWIDSDIVVVRDFRPLFRGLSPEHVGVVEETFGVPYQGGTTRTVGLGFRVGRKMRLTANSCVTRVTASHHPLLSAWEKRLREPDYVAAQAQPLNERAQWFKGDQDVLTGLLGSEEFAHLPIHWLRRGRDVAHCFQLGGVGYNVHERLRNIARGVPPVFAHSCGDRPWRPPEGRPTLHLETSPYTLEAARYEATVGESLPWTRPTLPAARVLRRAFDDSLNVSGLLPAIARELRDQRVVKTLLRPIFKRGE